MLRSKTVPRTLQHGIMEQIVTKCNGAPATSDIGRGLAAQRNAIGRAHNPSHMPVRAAVLLQSTSGKWDRPQ
jgi:hypothetical protein